jgi:hypothetical protein
MDGKRDGLHSVLQMAGLKHGPAMFRALGDVRATVRRCIAWE